MMVDSDLAEQRACGADRRARDGRLVTGVTGQDGSYLAERLRRRGLGGPRPGPRRPARPSSPGSSPTSATSRSRRCSTGLLPAVEPDVVPTWRACRRWRSRGTEPGRDGRPHRGRRRPAAQAAVRPRGARGAVPGSCSRPAPRCSGRRPSPRRTRRRPCAPASPYGAAKAYALHLAGVYRRPGTTWAPRCSTTTSRRAGRRRSSPARSPRRCRHRTRAAPTCCGRQPRREAGLGLGPGPRRRHGADGRGRDPRRLRRRHRAGHTVRDFVAAAFPRPGSSTGSTWSRRPAVLPSRRRRRPRRGRLAGPRPARLGPDGLLRGGRRPDGGRRPRPAGRSRPPRRPARALTARPAPDG